MKALKPLGQKNSRGGGAGRAVTASVFSHMHASTVQAKLLRMVRQKKEGC